MSHYSRGQHSSNTKMESYPQNNMYHVTFPRVLYWTHIFLFIIYVNDFPKCLQHTTPTMFADDTYIIYTYLCTYIRI